MTLAELLRRLADHLQARSPQLRVLSQHAYQAEGWFKTEVLTWLESERRSGNVTEVAREVTLAGRRKADIVVAIGEQRHWIELKHWLIGRQAGRTYTPAFYAVDRTGLGLHHDAAKLHAAAAANHRWLLILATSSPGKGGWLEALGIYSSTFRTPKLLLETSYDSEDGIFGYGLFRVAPQGNLIGFSP